MRAIKSTGIFFIVMMVMMIYSWANICEEVMAKKTTVRDRIAEEYPDVDLLFMTEPEYDKAIIGVSEMCCGTNNHHQVIYDWDKIIKINMKQGMSELEAIEHFEYNQGGAYVGEHTPIFVKTRSNIIGE